MDSEAGNIVLENDMEINISFPGDGWWYIDLIELSFNDLSNYFKEHDSFIINKSDFNSIVKERERCDSRNELHYIDPSNNFKTYFRCLGDIRPRREDTEYSINEFGDDRLSRSVYNLKNDMQNIESIIDVDTEAMEAYETMEEYLNSLKIKIKHRGSSKSKRIEIQKDYDYYFMKVGKRDGYCCKKCGAIKDLTIDHLNPLINGGTNSIENLQLLCKVCNSSKGGSCE